MSRRSKQGSRLRQPHTAPLNHGERRSTCAVVSRRLYATISTHFTVRSPSPPYSPVGPYRGRRRVGAVSFVSNRKVVAAHNDRPRNPPVPSRRGTASMRRTRISRCYSEHSLLQEAPLPKTLVAIVFGLYLLLVLILTLGMFTVRNPQPNLILFHSILHDWSVGGSSFVVNFLGNLVVFAPLGFMMPIVRSHPTHLKHVALFGLVLSGMIEVAQYCSDRRVADIDDVLLNVAGMLMGYVVLRLWRASPECAVLGRIRGAR
jgi:glycopeptide antibiotics resistance protein